MYPPFMLARLPRLRRGQTLLAKVKNILKIDALASPSPAIDRYNKSVFLPFQFKRLSLTTRSNAFLGFREDKAEQ